MIQIGDILQTSYDSGPYRVVSIDRDCTCARYWDELNEEGPMQFESPPHVHLICRHLKIEELRPNASNNEHYLGGYNEETLQSVWNDDYLILLERPGGQQELF